MAEINTYYRHAAIGNEMDRTEQCSISTNGKKKVHGAAVLPLLFNRRTIGVDFNSFHTFFFKYMDQFIKMLLRIGGNLSVI